MANYLYEKKLSDLGIDGLNDPVLNHKWVEKVKEMLSLAENSETPETEIKKIDAQLVKLFDEMHDIEEVDDEQLVRLKQENEAAKKKIATLDDRMEKLLKAEEARLERERKAEERRIKALEKAQKAKEAREAKAKEEAEAKAKAEADAKSKEEAEAQAKADKLRANKDAIIEKLMSRTSHSASALRSLGLDTGSSKIDFHGVVLKKEFLLTSYKLTDVPKEYIFKFWDGKLPDGTEIEPDEPKGKKEPTTTPKGEEGSEGEEQNAGGEGGEQMTPEPQGQE